MSNHNIPLIYFSNKRGTVLVYLSNAVEKVCNVAKFEHDGAWSKWDPYGFDKTNIIQMLWKMPIRGAGVYLFVQPNSMFIMHF